jgi:dTDP-4-amino-4,6-dideoxygalactose transaminase
MRRIHTADLKIGSEEKKAVMDVLNSGRISEWERVKEFEREWARFIGTKYSILVSSGTTALMAGLTALKYCKNIKERKKIITTPLTYVATSNAIVTTNFEPVYVDVDLQTFGITPEAIEKHLDTVKDPENYSVILPVHLMGYPCDMDRINKIAKKYDLITFEDCAQSHGTIYKGKKTGSLSLLSAFSFGIPHNISIGEVGAVNTDDYEIIRIIRKIKANGRLCDCEVCVRNTRGCPKMKTYRGKDDFDPRLTHDIIGYNFKVMEFQATLGLVQLKRINWIIRKRQENVKYLNDGLEKYSDILQLPVYSNKVSYPDYPLVIKNPRIISRKKLRTELERRGVETRPLFPSIPTQQPAYSYLRGKYEGKLRNADYLSLNAFFIGCHQYLTRSDLDYIIESFKQILGA